MVSSMDIFCRACRKKGDRKIIWRVIKFDLRVLCGNHPTLSMVVNCAGHGANLIFPQTFRTTLNLTICTDGFGWRSGRRRGEKAQVNTDKAPSIMEILGKVRHLGRGPCLFSFVPQILMDQQQPLALCRCNFWFNKAKSFSGRGYFGYFSYIFRGDHRECVAFRCWMYPISI